MSEARFGRSLAEDLVDAQRGWNDFVSYAINEAVKGNHDPMRFVLETSAERVMQRMEERARGRP